MESSYTFLLQICWWKDELSSLCESMGIPYTGSTRLSLGDAFRSATGDIRERVPVTVDGETNIYLAYCRDNKRTAGVFSRELVKETLNRETNRYEKLANISCGKNDGMFRCDNLVLDDAVDVQGCCRKAEELFELYQRCANRKQIETICVNFLRGMEATKLSVTGHMYFVPRTFMERVDIFEDFITLLSGLNKKQTPLVVNSFYIIDDAKQRDKMTEEFYLAVKKEIAAYQEKCDYLIKSSSQSPAVMERWVLKVQALEEKRGQIRCRRCHGTSHVHAVFDTHIHDFSGRDPCDLCHRITHLGCQQESPASRYRPGRRFRSLSAIFQRETELLFRTCEMTGCHTDNLRSKPAPYRHCTKAQAFPTG